MKKLLTCIFCLIVNMSSFGQSTTDTKVDLTLTVKPHLCLRHADGDECRVEVIIDWRSNTAANFCLFSDLDKTSLQCWDHQQNGNRIELRVISEDLNYWVSIEGTSEKLAQRSVKIATLVSDERRSLRQRRHIWSLI